MADEQPRSTGAWQRTVIDDERETATPTIPLRSGSSRRAPANGITRVSAASRASRSGEAVTATRSSYRRTSSRYTTKGRRTKKILIRLGIAVAAVLAVGGVVLGIANWAGIIGNDGGGEDDTTIIPLRSRGREADLPVVNVDTLIAGLAEIDASADGLAVFSTTTKDFTISDDERQALAGAIAQADAVLHPRSEEAGEEDADGTDEGEEAQASGDVSEDAENTFSTDNITVFAMDLEESHGVASNLDAYVQGAQSIKALFATYFASQFLDTAKATPEQEGVQVALSLDDSQDALYEQLRAAYDEYGWDAWVGGVGARSCTTSAGYYPLISCRMEARAWLNVYRYLTGGTYGATWLGEQLESQSSSLTVHALSTTRTVQIGEDALEIAPIAAPMTVWSFGGAANSPTRGDSCIVENAIILVEGRSYLICVLTGLPDTATNRELVENIIAAAAQTIIHVETIADTGEGVAEEA